MYVVSGRTWPHRNLFVSFRTGRYDNHAKVWRFEYLTEVQKMQVAACLGVVLTEERPTYVPAPDHKPPARPVRSGETIFVGDDPTYMGEFADPNPIAFFGFSSLGAMCDHIDSLTIPDNEDGYCNVGWSTTPMRVKATGTANMGEALKLAREGWTDGLGLSHLFDAPHAERKRRSNGIAGGSVNVGRMLAGNPAHMLRRTPQPKNKSITLFTEIVMWEAISAENVMLRALLIASMIDLLEQLGYSCEVYAVGASLSQHDGMSQSHTCINVKSAGERLSILDISFALGHPSLLRRFKFACEGATPQIAIGSENRGIVSKAFKRNHPPPRNSYYIRQIPSDLSRVAQYAVDPMQMFDDIVPPDFPVDLKRYTR